MKMSNNPAKYEGLIKQYMRSILDMSGIVQDVFQVFYVCIMFFQALVKWQE